MAKKETKTPKPSMPATRLAHSITLLHSHNILSASKAEEARKKLLKKIEKEYLSRKNISS